MIYKIKTFLLKYLFNIIGVKAYINIFNKNFYIYIAILKVFKKLYLYINI